MDIAILFTPEFSLIAIPLFIFLARIVDVSMGTIRIISVSRGNRYMAPLLGFFEVLVWLFALGSIFTNLTNIFCYLAYAGGFAMGTFVGIRLEERMAVGNVLVRVITRRDASELISFLEESGYGTTSIESSGNGKRSHLIFTIIRRKNVKDVVGIINRFNPKAFYTIADIRSVKEGVFPVKPNRRKRIGRMGHRKDK